MIKKAGKWAILTVIVLGICSLMTWLFHAQRRADGFEDEAIRWDLKHEDEVSGLTRDALKNEMDAPALWAYLQDRITENQNRYASFRSRIESLKIDKIYSPEVLGDAEQLNAKLETVKRVVENGKNYAQFLEAYLERIIEEIDQTNIPDSEKIRLKGEFAHRKPQIDLTRDIVLVQVLSFETVLEQLRIFVENSGAFSFGEDGSVGTEDPSLGETYRLLKERLEELMEREKELLSSFQAESQAYKKEYSNMS